MEDGGYECECGAKFTEPNKFNAHKSHCRIHLGEEKGQARYAHMKKMSSAGNTNKKKYAELRKQEALNKGISEKHVCEHCGKVMTEKYGSGRFCCKSCANAREQSDELKKKKSETVHQTLLNKQTDEIIQNPKYKFYSGYYEGIYCASSYEFLFLVYCLKNNIKIERCKYRFSYSYDGHKHVYFPDFYLPETDEIIEIKGKNEYYDDERIQAKNNAVHGHKFRIIYDDEINSFYLDGFINYFNLNRIDVYSHIRELLACNKHMRQKTIAAVNKKHIARTKNYVGIHKDNKNTLVPSEALEKYLADGGIKGKLLSQKQIEKKKQHRKNHPAKIKIDRKGKKQIHRGEERIFVLPEQLSEYISKGGELGTGHKQNPEHHSGGNHSHTNLNKKKVVIDGKITFK